MTSRTKNSNLLISLVDAYSKEEPPRVWAMLPNDDDDLSRGFRDVTYRQLSNAVNHAAHWLLQSLPPAVEPFGTVAYVGPKDIRHSIVALAVGKLRRKVLLPSPFASTKAKSHLLGLSKADVLLYGDSSFKEGVEATVAGVEGSKPALIKLPGLPTFLTDDIAEHIPYTRTWDEVKLEPWIILHTSGTTGLPKLVPYTHQMLAALDTAKFMPDANEDNILTHFANRRWYTPLPTLHVVGMLLSLQVTIYHNAILVAGPSGTGGQATPQTALSVLKHAKVQGALLPPSLIDSLVATPSGLDALRDLEYLYFAGAPMKPSTAHTLINENNVTLKPGMGSTEAGLYWMHDTDEWEYYSFRPAMGIEFRKRTAELYELVFVRQPEWERYQLVFHIHVELAEFPTKDLFSPHPNKPGFWKYVGRTDDMIVFSHGEDLYAAGVEKVISSCQAVKGVLVGGQGRAKPFLLVEWIPEVGDEEKTLERLWPFVEKANGDCSPLVRLTKDLCFSVQGGKEFVRTIKGTVARRETEDAFAEEIERLYADDS
ncbi:unnamed protein product [Periconia digitata]|uniref:AMP-dependent synthetase/ligase domain-containing protein n=1 Tax=Periconia digitata TaxID=1303443 RepID=A0A9W4UGN1_9PLEO|nr:unnamed protein product [Periconia digitata]